MNKNLVL